MDETDAGDQRHVGRLHGAGAEDGDPDGGTCEDQLPAGSRSGSRRHRRAGDAASRDSRAERNSALDLRHRSGSASGAHSRRPLRARGCGRGASGSLWRASPDRAQRWHRADRRALSAPHGARHRVLLLLHRGRGLSRAERVLPRASIARGTRGVGALLGAAWRGASVTTSRDVDDTAGSAPPGSELARAEQRVVAHSRSLKKELGVRDLVLTQILFIVGLTWIGVAGKLGSAHVVFWLTALTLFYLPSAAVVMYLNKLMPLEGGL